MGGRRDPAHVRLHAGAHVQQEDDVDGHLLTLEVADLLLLPVLAQDEILFGQTRDGTVGAIDHLHVHALERDVTSERNGGIAGLRVGRWRVVLQRGGEQTD